MLSYAFQILKQSNYDEVASEKFDNAQDLFAAILSKGIAQQLKQGLYYIGIIFFFAIGAGIGGNLSMRFGIPAIRISVGLLLVSLLLMFIEKE